MRAQPRPEGYVSRHRFILLFGTLLVFYVLVPIVNEVRGVLHPLLPQVLEGGLFVAVMTGAVISTGRSVLRAVTATMLGAALVVAWAAHLFSAWDLLGVFRDLLGIVFFGYAIGVMFHFIQSSRRVTFNTVSASLCIYLLFGIVWGMAYSAIDALSPGSFTWNVAGHAQTPFRIGKGDTAVLYFSFATLTTLGYGDIVPTAPISRMLATTEAITGQLYLAVMVARLVGLHIAASLDERPRGEGGNGGKP